jgi:signal transduction histidine kinase
MFRSLASRLVAAFVAVSLVVLLAVGGALFVVLRGLHADATTAGLEDVAGSVLPQVRDAVGSGNLAGTLLEVRDTLAARDIQLLVIGPDGALRPIGGQPISPVILTAPLSVGATDHGRVDLSGRPYLWVAAGVRRATAAAPLAIAFVTQDRSAGQTLADLGRAIPAVILVTLLVAAPLSWLLARSVSRPLRRVAASAASLPAEGHTPIPPEGPAEVRELIGTFNGMAAELEATRQRESELLANLRHDLRTPLTVISGFATALRDGTATGEAAASAARAIDEEAARLEHLVDELGEVERLRDGAAALRPEALDATEIAAATVERFRERAARAGVQLQLSDPDPSFGPRLVADRVALERMLGNLVGNALAAVPPGAHVRLELANASIAGRPAVRIDVVDDGPGFPAGSEARAFERFWRADPSRGGGGSGLGLAIVRELARAHGGDAHLETVSPHGARVGVVLPRSPGAGEGKAA